MIKVPATSANVGCGFDSMGFAVNLFLEVEIVDFSTRWQVIHDFGSDIPTDESNLIVETAITIAPDLKPRIIRVTSNIPLERGLGSSSTAIVAGIELASQLGEKKLTLAEKLQLACSLEGHPDNVAPAILGGFVISYYADNKLSYVKVDLEDLALVAFVPNYKMSTKKMREVLPETLLHQEATSASAIANTMIAHLLTKNYKEAGKLIESDLLHEPYRNKLIPELAEIRKIAHLHGAYATYLSGAGSTIMTLMPPKQKKAFIKELSKFENGTVLSLEILTKGSHET